MIRSDASRDLSRLLAIVVGVVVIAALHLAKVVLLPLGLAILFTFLLAPLVTILERGKIPRVLAILLVLAAFGSGVGVVGWTVVTQIVQVTAQLPAYRTNIAEKVAMFHHTGDTSFARAEQSVEHLSQEIGFSHPEPARSGRRHSLRESAPSPEHPVAVEEVGHPGFSLDSLQGVLEQMAFVLLVIVFTFFMLLQRESLRNRLIRLSGHGHLNVMTQAMDEASNRVSRYFSLQLLVNTCYGTIVFTALHFIGLPHALLWGSLAGLFRFIPYIGAPIAALLPTLLSMAVFHGWTQTLLIVALFFCMEIVTANLVEPHLYGKHTGLSSLAILVAAVFWTLIWGPIGLILSVPLTVCLVVVGAHVPELGFLKVLLGDQPVMRPEAHYYQRLLANDEHEAAQVLETSLKDQSLEQLYDTVLIPALTLSEQDRHRNALDDRTVVFINQTTRELVEELGVRFEKQIEPTPPMEGQDAESPPESDAPGQPTAVAPPLSPRKIVCIPVRDTADEIVAIMLTQLLEHAGHHAQSISLNHVDHMLEEVARAQPDLVYLSGLPPYAISYERTLYKKVRRQFPQLKIFLGLWNYSGDPVKTAREISGGEQERISTTLAGAVAQASEDAPPKAPQETAIGASVA